MDYCMIGHKIRIFRKKNGLSQEELAEKVNISTTHMSHIETGGTKLSLPVLVDIANALNVRTDDLLDRTASISSNNSLDEISLILKQCSDDEAAFIAEMVRNIKAAKDKYL